MCKSTQLPFAGGKAHFSLEASQSADAAYQVAKQIFKNYKREFGFMFESTLVSMMLVEFQKEGMSFTQEEMVQLASKVIKNTALEA